jgi:hypothetical protein
VPELVGDPGNAQQPRLMRPLERDGPALLTAADRYEAARWPLSAARALEAGRWGAGQVTAGPLGDPPAARADFDGRVHEQRGGPPGQVRARPPLKADNGSVVTRLWT